MNKRSMALLLALVFVLPAAAFADTSATSTSNAYVLYGNAGDSQANSGAAGAPSSSSAFSELGTSSVLPPYANGSSSAFGSEGFLSASVHAYATTPGGAFDYYVYNIGSEGRSFARATWSDVITVNAAGASLGSAGYITAQMSLSGAYGGSMGPTGPLDTAEYYGIGRVLGTGIVGGGSGACGGWTYCGWNDALSWTTGTSYSDLPSTLDVKIPIYFGSAASLGYTLEVVDTAMAHTSDPKSGIYGTGTYADAFSNYTLRWSGITGVYDAGNNLLPSFSVSSGSGFDYTNTVAAIPEPRTYALLLAGLGLLGFEVKRRHKASVA